MKRIVLIVIFIFVVGLFGFEKVIDFVMSRNVIDPREAIEVLKIQDTSTTTGTEVFLADMPSRTVVVENLTIPWDIVFLGQDDLLVSERDGTIVRINVQTGNTFEIDVPDVSHRGEGGLLGMVAHPQFSDNRYLYLYMTSVLDEGSNSSVNEVIRYRFLNNTLSERTVIIGNIPGSLFHNGGRIAFGPEGLLYVTTGDARVPESAQDLDSLAGKILRVDEDGGIPSENPFGTMVYSYGNRNPQGLTWDENGNLWSTEHGRTTATKTGMDEVNLIISGGNYGWPSSEGDTVLEGTIAPKLHSGPSVTWAPASGVFWDGSIFFGGLRGETLYEAVLDGSNIMELKKHFTGEYGRIRTVLLGPDGALYITTSNRDKRGEVSGGDDRIIQLNPLQFRE